MKKITILLLIGLFLGIASVFIVQIAINIPNKSGVEVYSKYCSSLPGTPDNFKIYEYEYNNKKYLIVENKYGDISITKAEE